MVALWAMPSPAAAAERLYCFSDICLGDPPSVLNAVEINDLSRIANSRPAALDLKAALPELNDADRKLLAGHVTEDGRFLLDQKTLRIFLRIKGVCASIAPFVAIFTSDSGHSTAVEFDVIDADDHVRLGVKSIARVFRTRPNTPEYVALIADLSQKFGFKIGDEPLHQARDGISTTFEVNAEGFRLAFSMPSLKDRGREIASQRDCEPVNRVKID